MVFSVTAEAVMTQEESESPLPGPRRVVLMYTADFASLHYSGRSTQAFMRSHLQKGKMINEELEMLERTFIRSGLCQYREQDVKSTLEE